MAKTWVEARMSLNLTDQPQRLQTMDRTAGEMLEVIGERVWKELLGRTALWWFQRQKKKPLTQRSLVSSTSDKWSP